MSVPVSLLDLTGSPRLNGIDHRHVELLREADPHALPPVLVHRPTMRVVDGVHRVHAALLRGDPMIDAIFVEGDDDELFVRSVRENIGHGLPLSLADRQAAALRMLAVRPDWSDRMIARNVGLSPRTVGALRRRHDDAPAAPGHRVGLDGRVYRLDTGHAREAVRQALARNPSASVREIARSAGISVGHAHTLRRELLGGGDTGTPVAAPPRSAAAPLARPVGQGIPVALVRTLAADPSIKLTDRGRDLLRLLATQALGPGDWSDLLAAVPSHRAEAVITLADGLATAWRQFADELRER
ncbi:ParB/RepB/Spo0J family partition protein [Kitasatospora viridis]|uniref:ParB/RepB/Spo0J family partition protein n=1 Tax=Kitasatospora viridis TaxID=281105 RepID=UPI001FE765D2|nr:ParB N-terminal domain-containing protein [Kitasatospora viridis]